MYSTGKDLYIMKKILTVIIAGIFVLAAFTACRTSPEGEISGDSAVESEVSEETGAEISTETSTETSADAKPDLTALSKQFEEKFKAADRRLLAEDEIYQDTGIDPAGCDSFFWLAEVSGLSSEKAVVFMAKDEAGAQEIKTKLNTVLESELAQQKDYNADNYAMLQKAVLDVKGVYVYLLVSPNVDEFKKIADSAF